MKKYLITYDLKDTPLTNYINLHEEIKRIGSSWWHYLESTWIIKSTAVSAGDISTRLIPHLKQGDRIFVVEITGNMQGLLPKDAWEWLRN